MIKFRVVFKAFTDKLSEPQKVEFADLCKKYDAKGLSFIIGAGMRKELVDMSDIKLVGVGGKQGVMQRPMFIITVSVDTKNLLSHEELEQDYYKILIYMKEFIESYTIEITET
jgi:hypothetical protein